MFRSERRRNREGNIGGIHHLFQMNSGDCIIVAFGEGIAEIKPESRPLWKDLSHNSLIHFADDFWSYTETSQAECNEMPHLCGEFNQ